MLADFFEQIFCIYLKGTAQRDQQFAQAQMEFAKIGILHNVEFVEGVDGKALNLGGQKASDGQISSPGDIGCVLSHLKVVRMAQERLLRNYLVFEVDVEFDEDFAYKFNERILELPRDYHMIYFGGNHDEPVTRVSKHIVRCNKTFTTHAVGVHASAYSDLINVLSEEGDKVDLYFSSLHKIKNCYCFYPHLCFQRQGNSEILDKEVDYMHLRNFQMIPLGLSPISTFVIQNHFSRNKTYPYDFVNVNLLSMFNLLNIRDNEIDEQAPFFGLEKARLHNLFNAFRGKDNLIFLTVFKDMPNIGEAVVYDQIKKRLQALVKNISVFVTVNLTNADFTNDDRHSNIVVPFEENDEDPALRFEIDIARRLQSYHVTAKYFF